MRSYIPILADGAAPAKLVQDKPPPRGPKVSNNEPISFQDQLKMRLKKRSEESNLMHRLNFSCLLYSRRFSRA